MIASGESMSWWRARLRWSVLRTTLVIITALGLGALSLSATGARRVGSTQQGVTPPMSNLEAIAFLIDLVLLVLFVWRRRWPVPLTLAACVATIVLPLDGFLPVVGLVSVLVLVRDWRVPVAALAVSAAEVVWVVRDTQGRYPVQSFWRSIFTYPPGREFPWWVALIIALVLVAVSIATAVGITARRQLDAATETGNASQLKLDILGTEVARQAERERIAREVHDVLGHRLSLLSLHAGALEVSAGSDPRMAQSAALVREGAQQSMADLRSLLNVLRTPDAPDVTRQVRTVADLPTLVTESLDAGNPVLSSIFVDQAATLDPHISHSAYRIVQELLTNARRHAPGTPVRLEVRGGPQTGVEVVTTNWCRQHPPRALVVGNGLTGIRERVEQYGGQFRAVIDPQGAFRVALLLPWTWSGERTDARSATRAPTSERSA
ncbi:sensor histidine kinase [Allobranchiibius sp. GilTou73]|uniref:sensor histidine kinase n=1 Tax=Allobranchiibius sp. GilTou73 TaxID=2904523 RepID=UPI001F244C78|nr:histidine kinase [Allobranchiibius sp. GilTou73]UIJ35250.1 histidine kinase [Allobranchiibius sp. GilTou73]